ncbi:MAG: transposase [Pseudomonadota bacterium]|nr:transposase [Pseudomonadota bacterium]
MNFDDYTFLPLKVIRTGPGGKRTFDRAGKRMLVEACLVPGVSISGMALKAGVNANQLHKWIRSGQRSHLPAAPVRGEPVPAFMPVVQIDSVPDQKRPATAPPPARVPSPSPVRLSARLANGVAVELECTANDAALVTAMIAALGAR